MSLLGVIVDLELSFPINFERIFICLYVIWEISYTFAF